MVCPKLYLICGLDNEFIGEMLLSEKCEGKACRPMCQICFNNGTELMIYGRRKVLIVNRKRRTFCEGSTKMNSNQIILLIKESMIIIVIKYSKKVLQKLK